MARKGSKRKTTAPRTAAGLITYFEEEVGGLKLRPEVVVALTVGLMLLVILAHIIIPVPP
ncbi:MAG: preprotein translocase subunit Sec61beta [Thermofilaceae archaeon]